MGVNTPSVSRSQPPVGSLSRYVYDALHHLAPENFTNKIKLSLLFQIDPSYKELKKTDADCRTHLARVKIDPKIRVKRLGK